MNELVKISTDAPTPIMHVAAAANFEALRREVRIASGVDFLARCGDVFRPSSFTSKKDGVANRSWHKAGRCFDYDQTSNALVIVSEKEGKHQYFRTYLICAKQDGSQGVKRTLRDYRGGSTSGYVVDFTKLAKAHKFDRIPAWSGWQTHYNRREFWHYQMTSGLSWAAAMAQISGSKTSSVMEAKKLIGLNDRDKNTGGVVSKIQRKLSDLGFLIGDEIDGIYGKNTFAAVKKFQRSKGVSVDGICGKITRGLLGV